MTSAPRTALPWRRVRRVAGRPASRRDHRLSSAGVHARVAPGAGACARRDGGTSAGPAIAVVAGGRTCGGRLRDCRTRPAIALTEALRARERALLARAKAEQARVAGRWQGSLFERRTARIVEAARAGAAVADRRAPAEARRTGRRRRRRAGRRGSRVAGGADVPTALSGPLLSAEYLRQADAGPRRRCPWRRCASVPRAARAGWPQPRAGDPSGTCLRDRRRARWFGGSGGPRHVRPRVDGGPLAAASRWSPRVPTRSGLVVVPYGRAQAEFARQATRAALTLGHRWVLVTDGLSLRLVDGLRGESRGFVDFDLDECARDAPSLAWLTRLAGPPAFVAGDRRATCRDGSTAPTHTAGASAARCARASATRSARSPPPSRRRRGAGAICTRATPTRSPRSIARCFCCSPRRDSWCRCGTPSIAAATASRRFAPGLAESRPPRGTWAALQAIARLAHAGAEAGDLRVTPFNGRLFAPARAPLLDHLALDDERVASALDALCFTRAATDGGRQRIAYARAWRGGTRLGVREPAGPRAGCARGRRRARRQRHPRSTCADPPAPRARPPAPSTRRARLPTRWCATRWPRWWMDGRPSRSCRCAYWTRRWAAARSWSSAGRFLAAEWERALVERGDATEGDLSDADRAATRRLIASRCLFGVDRNPMAVQLAQLSVWLATLAADRPLSFLDHHLVAGNSLVGASPLDVLARPPARGRRPAPLPLDALFEWSGALVSVRARRRDIETAQDDSADIVHGKEAALARIADDPGLARWKARVRPVVRRVDARRTRPAASITRCSTAALAGRRSSRVRSTPRVSELGRGPAQSGCFHWPLEFPEVFLDDEGRPRPDGGFDAVVGNPPWEMLRADGRRDAAAAGEGEALVRFARDSGVYSVAGPRPRQPVSAVRRARAPRHPARRAHRAHRAGEPAHRRGQRAAAPRLDRRQPAGHGDGVRQPAGAVPYSPKRAICDVHGRPQRPHDGDPLSLRRQPIPQPCTQLRR